MIVAMVVLTVLSVAAISYGLVLLAERWIDR